MSIVSWLRDKIQERRKAVQLGEPDAPGDLGTARTRATGGVPDPDAPDTHSTTGTTPGGMFVGRATGDDPGYTGDTGAERRAEAHPDGEDTDGPAPQRHAAGGRHRAGAPPNRPAHPPKDRQADA